MYTEHSPSSRLGTNSSRQLPRICDSHFSHCLYHSNTGWWHLRCSEIKFPRCFSLLFASFKQLTVLTVPAYQLTSSYNCPDTTSVVHRQVVLNLSLWLQFAPGPDVAVPTRAHCSNRPSAGQAPHQSSAPPQRSYSPDQAHLSQQQLPRKVICESSW